MDKLTEEQEALLDELSDEQLEKECRARGIWFDESECEECDECADCGCDEFEDTCREIWQAFYLGQDDKAMGLLKDMVQRVSGRYL